MTALRSHDYLGAILTDAHARTLSLIDGLSGDRLMGPRLLIVNPRLWEIGHTAWFHESFILRGRDNRAPLIDNADALYDSMAVAHHTRWGLPLPGLDRTLAYRNAVRDALIERLGQRCVEADDSYLYQLTVFHEDMHGEALTYTRQTLGDPAPPGAVATPDRAGPLPGDVEVPGGTFVLGSHPNAPFLFDNEKWAHPVELAPFRIARAPVTNGEFAEFVEAQGYARDAYWSEEGWAWKERENARQPIYWSKHGVHGWTLRLFDREIPLPEHEPMAHVSWYEARAWCRFAGRRLPSEAEWEATAAGTPAAGMPAAGTLAAGTLAAGASADGSRLAFGKRRYPWGQTAPEPRHARLDGARLGCADVAAHPDGDSAFGCRQMLGNVWEWTSSDFEPFPGFSPDVYRDYSVPWFGTHKVLRGGCWATRARLVNNAYRNFFEPWRRDIFAGFRTCAP